MLRPQAVNRPQGMPVSSRTYKPACIIRWSLLTADFEPHWGSNSHGEHCRKAVSSSSLFPPSFTTPRKSEHIASPLLQKSKSYSHTPATLQEAVWGQEASPCLGHKGDCYLFTQALLFVNTASAPLRQKAGAQAGREGGCGTSASLLGRGKKTPGLQPGPAASGTAGSHRDTPPPTAALSPGPPHPPAGVTLTAVPGSRGGRRAAWSRREHPGDAAPSSSGASGGTRSAAWARQRRRGGGGGLAGRPPPRAPSPPTRCVRRGAGSGRAGPCRAPRRGGRRRGCGRRRCPPAGSRGRSGSGRSAGRPAVAGSRRAWTGQRWQPPASAYAFNKEIAFLPPSLPTAGRVGPSPPREPRRGRLPAGRTGKGAAPPVIRAQGAH